MVALTGTPINNRYNDLANIMHCLRAAPSKLHCSQFYADATPAQLKDFARRFLIRRKIESVGLQLPPLLAHNHLLAWDANNPAIPK